MSEQITINEGEVVVKFNKPTAGKLSFADLGLKDDQLILDGGFLRLVFDLEGIGEHEYFAVPTLEVSYKQAQAETHWICEFNEVTILDKKNTF